MIHIDRTLTLNILSLVFRDLGMQLAFSWHIVCLWERWAFHRNLISFLKWWSEFWVIIGWLWILAVDKLWCFEDCFFLSHCVGSNLHECFLQWEVEFCFSTRGAVRDRGQSVLLWGLFALATSYLQYGLFAFVQVAYTPWAGSGGACLWTREGIMHGPVPSSFWGVSPIFI